MQPCSKLRRNWSSLQTATVRKKLIYAPQMNKKNDEINGQEFPILIPWTMDRISVSIPVWETFHWFIFMHLYSNKDPQEYRPKKLCKAVFF